MKKLSHNIRFERDDKERLQELANIHSGGQFQTEVTKAIQYYLKDHKTVAFLDRARCALEALPLGTRTVKMAQIANILEIELEIE